MIEEIAHAKTQSDFTHPFDEHGIQALCDALVALFDPFFARWFLENHARAVPLSVRKRQELLHVLHTRSVFERPKAARVVAATMKAGRATDHSDIRSFDLLKG